jgi:hypothetical protein
MAQLPAGATQERTQKVRDEVRGYIPGFSIHGKLREDKLTDLKYRAEVKLHPDIAGIRIDRFWRQINLPGSGVGVASVQQGKKRSLFLSRQHAQAPATRNVVYRILRSIRAPVDELPAKRL